MQTETMDVRAVSERLRAVVAQGAIKDPHLAHLLDARLSKVERLGGCTSLPLRISESDATETDKETSWVHTWTWPF